MRDRPPQHGIQGAGRRLAGLLTVLLPLIAGAGLVRAEGDSFPGALPWRSGASTFRSFCSSSRRALSDAPN